MRNGFLNAVNGSTRAPAPANFTAAGRSRRSQPSQSRKKFTIPAQPDRIISRNISRCRQTHHNTSAMPATHTATRNHRTVVSAAAGSSTAPGGAD